MAITRLELSKRWENRIDSADRVYKAWYDRFKLDALYSYYEGFQWLYEVDESNRPYVVNLVYSIIETKLPNLIVDNPEFSLSPRPTGTTFDMNKAMEDSQLREDALNFICSQKKFGITDKHELAILDAFFGFGVLETDYSSDRAINPYLNSKGSNKIDDLLYCKHIPFDNFRVSGAANWDLSSGKWYGYFEWTPQERLEKYKNKLNLDYNPLQDADEVFAVDGATGKLTIASESTWIVGPAGHYKIWHLWDFETEKFCLFAPDNAIGSDRILEYKDFDHSPISTLRFGKRRKGWYPYPPVWNWISPQDEVNDIAQTQKVHRKRFMRKYMVLENAFADANEEDKFLTGPDGTTFKVTRMDAIKAVDNPTLDPSAIQGLQRSYDDINRISGSSSEKQQVADRTTATQAQLMSQAAQIRESKDVMRVGNFMEDFGRNVLVAIRKSPGSFWAMVKDRSEGFIGEVKKVNKLWKKIPSTVFRGDDSDITLNVASVSPLAQNADKQKFMEFLALISQYEILAFSPDLLREAAYRVGYKNSVVLGQFQQWAQIAALGKSMQLKAQVQAAAPQMPQGAQPGQLQQQQTNASTPPDMQDIANLMFNRLPVQGSPGGGQPQ